MKKHKARVRSGWGQLSVSSTACPTPNLALGSRVAPLAAITSLQLDCHWPSQVSLTTVLPGWTPSPFYRRRN